MARKGVNLLEGDDDEEREGDPEMDSGDGGGDYERRRGGFVDALMVILFVCVMLGGVAWAGYQFWWLPKVKKEAQLNRIHMKQEQQRKMRLTKTGGATQRELSSAEATERLYQPTGSQARKRTMSAPDRNMQSSQPAPPNPTEAPVTPVAPTMRGNSALPSPTEKAAPAGVARMEQSVSSARIEKKQLAASTMMQEPVTSAGTIMKPKREAAPAPREVVTTPQAKIIEKKATPKEANPGKQLAGKKKEKVAENVQSRAGARKPPQDFFYSVQVASCSTKRCADSFLKRLKGKGFSAFRVVGSGRVKKSGARMTEVRLGAFSSLVEARALASRAKKKKIRARVYRSDNRWRVAAGSFRNLEDAALLLDHVEDSGFRGELASRLQRGSGGNRRFYRVRTGKFQSLREALAFREKIRQGGFSDAIVVRQRLRK